MAPALLLEVLLAQRALGLLLFADLIMWLVLEAVVAVLLLEPQGLGVLTLPLEAVLRVQATVLVLEAVLATNHPAILGARQDQPLQHRLDGVQVAVVVLLTKLVRMVLRAISY